MNNEHKQKSTQKPEQVSQPTEMPNDGESISPPTPDVDRTGLPEQVQPAEKPDPFDPKRLTLSQDFAESLGVKKLLTTVPVRRPAKEWWVRTHPAEDYRLPTGVLELKEEGEIYLVDPELWAEMSDEPTFVRRALFLAINRQKVLFLWPIGLPDSTGRYNEWHKSAMVAAKDAADTWVRVVADKSLGAYVPHVVTGDLPAPAPEWPDLSFGEILRIAFRDRYIDDRNHPVLKQLRGEA